MASHSRRDAALDYPIDAIRHRYQQAFNVPASIASLRERELKRYLFIAAKNPDLTLPIAEVLDPLWHEFLLDTRCYLAFCRQMGADFVHHVPNTEHRSAGEMTDRYRKLVALYEQEFDEPPPRDVWPQLSQGIMRMGNCDPSIDLANCDASRVRIDPADGDATDR